jgi:hypothetical protein
MIINGGSRRAGAFFATHLMRADHNERVTLAEIRGLAALNVRDAFREMEAVASGTRCQNYFYHANLNPREGEQLTPEQWQQAADTLENSLGLTGQPRFVVEHEKDGRTHRHVVWSRIDADTMTAISDSLTYRKHEAAAREIEQACGHEPVESVLVQDRQTQRPDRNPQDWEAFRGQESKLDPKAIKAQVTALWQASDSGPAFAAALEQHGYILARGDRRDFCFVDAAGDEHSLARRISGVKAAEIRNRMSDIDATVLPSVEEARELARHRPDDAGDAAPETSLREADNGAAQDANSIPPLDARYREERTFAEVLAETIAEAEEERAFTNCGDPEPLADQPNTVTSPTFDAVERETISQAISYQSTIIGEAEGQAGGRFARVRAFWDNMREYVAGWREHVHERASHYLARWEKQEMQDRAAEYPSEPSPDVSPRPGVDLSP